MSDYSDRHIKLDGVTMTVSDLQEIDEHDLYIGMLRMNKDLEWLRDNILFYEKTAKEYRDLFEKYLTKEININLYEGKV